MVGSFGGRRLEDSMKSDQLLIVGCNRVAPSARQRGFPCWGNV